MKNVLVVCPTGRDRSELRAIGAHKNYNLIFHNYDDRILERVICQGIGWLTSDFDSARVLDELRIVCKNKSIDAVLSTEDYPGSLFASALADELPFNSPSVQSVLTCQHKYYSRVAQQQLVPEATPNFALLNKQACAVPFPAFVKPVKAYFSIFADRVNNQQELDRVRKKSCMPERFLDQFNWFVRTYSSFEHNASYLLAEELLQGEQVTVTGYVYQGHATILGITDSIMFPGTISFKRFDHPSQLVESVQERMSMTCARVMEGIGFDNGLFNIEMMYNPTTDALHIIEINPRMPSQFADLFEKVDGTNLYDIALSLALGEQPTFEKNAGLFSVAASFVLRVFEDKRVQAIPSQKELCRAKKLFPEIRIQLFATPGGLLSDECQDGKSFRYGLIHLGGMSWDDLHKRFAQCRQELTFELLPA